MSKTYSDQWPETAKLVGEMREVILVAETAMVRALFHPNDGSSRRLLDASINQCREILKKTEGME